MCFKQAGLMQDLRARLINGGFPEVEFRILNTANETSDELWRLRYAAGHPTIPVLQETPTHFLWHKLLDGAVDHILVLDRCNRLTYQVITPWSILHFPYVKAAILSTYEDDPCGGPCTESLEENISSSSSSSRTDDIYNNDNSTVDVSIPSNNSAETSSIESPFSSEQTTESVDIAENLVIDDTPHMKATLAPLTERTDGTVPIRVVMHAPHRHRHVNGTVTQHEYLELQTGNPHYHGHLASDNSIIQQTHKRKKYKGQKHKGKLRSEVIQAETQENNNYEDTKLKHHRDKQRPEKEKQKIKSGEEDGSEEAATTTGTTTIAATTTGTTTIAATTTGTTSIAATTTGTTTIAATTTGTTTIAAATTGTTTPLQDLTVTDTLEVNTEVGLQEIPQEIQEHYDYRNMPYYKQLHKPAVKVTEATTATAQEETDMPDSDTDHRKWKSHPLETENVNASITSNSSESFNSSQHNTNTLEDNSDLNFIVTEEYDKHKASETEKEMATTDSSEDDDESKKQVIEHYSKLLKWIHYTLPETTD